MESSFKCNHCDFNINIDENEFYQLYEEDQHEVDCPNCGKTVYVNSVAYYRFHVTDEDGEDIY